MDIRIIIYIWLYDYIIYQNPATVQFPFNPDVAPHLKRIIIIIIFLVLDGEWGNDPKDPIHILNLSS